MPESLVSLVSYRSFVTQQAVTDKTREEIALEVQDMSWGTFKPLLADATVEHLVSHILVLGTCSMFALKFMAAPVCG